MVSFNIYEARKVLYDSLFIFKKYKQKKKPIKVGKIFQNIPIIITSFKKTLDGLRKEVSQIVFQNLYYLIINKNYFSRVIDVTITSW